VRSVVRARSSGIGIRSCCDGVDRKSLRSGSVVVDVVEGVYLQHEDRLVASSQARNGSQVSLKDIVEVPRVVRAIARIK